jgi:hypothetical protein
VGSVSSSPELSLMRGRTPGVERSRYNIYLLHEKQPLAMAQYFRQDFYKQLFVKAACKYRSCE